MHFVSSAFLSLTVAAALSAALPSPPQVDMVPSSVLLKRSHMDYSVLDRNPDRTARVKAVIERAHIDAVEMARLADEELANNDLSVYRNYFPTDANSIQRVRAVLSRMLGGGGSSTGATVLGDIRVVVPWAEDQRGSCQPDDLARTTAGRLKLADDALGKAVMQVCSAFTYQPSTQSAVDNCKKHHGVLNRRKISMFNSQGGTIFHEWTHFNDIGNLDNLNPPLGERHAHDIIDIPTNGPGSPAAYSVEQVKKLAKTPKALNNAANYQWFAIHVYMEHNCSQNGKRRKITAN